MCHFRATSESHRPDSMSALGQIALAAVPNEETVPPPTIAMSAQPPSRGALESLRLHWPEYLMEAALLGGFMVSACAFTALFEFPQSPLHRAIPSGFLRRMLEGIAMGLTALCIFYSPWGKQSGAHINPAVTWTFFRLGKTKIWDAIFYSAAQFGGAVLGVSVMARLFGMAISHPAVRYAVTVPGPYGSRAALAAECVIAAGMMSMVLFVSNHSGLANYTGLFASILVATYITFEAPFSGMSINPARTFGSAFPAMVWNGFWIYLTAPMLGMLSAAEFYLWRKGRNAVKCGKLHHDNDKRCIFCGANGGFAS